MSEQMAIDWTGYPNTPGYRDTDTSRAAARAIAKKADTLKQQCLEVIRSSDGMTADEVAEKLGESVLSIRPRVTELGRKGAVIDTKIRRRNISGRSAIVWRGA